MHQSSPSIRWIFRVSMLNFDSESLAISVVIPSNAGKRSVGTVRTFFFEYLSNSLLHPDMASVPFGTVPPMEPFMSAEISCNVKYPFLVSGGTILKSVSHSEALASLHCHKTPSSVKNRFRETDIRSCNTQPRLDRAEDSTMMFQSGIVAFKVLRSLDHVSLVKA